MLERLWRIAEAARAAWEWWGLLAWLGVVPGVLVVLGFFEGQPWSVIALYVLVAIAFWIVLVAEGKPIIEERKRRRPAGLMALRAEGVVQILNRPVQAGNVNDVLLHRHAVVDWDERVGRALKDAGVQESDIGWFTTLGLFTPRFTGLGNPVYQQYQNILAEKLERLEQIVRRLDDRRLR